MASRRRITSSLAAVALLVAACSGGATTSPGEGSPEASAPGPSAPAASVPAASEPAAADICTAPPKAEGLTLTFASYGGAYQEAQRKGWLERLTGVLGAGLCAGAVGLAETIDWCRLPM